MLAVLDPTSTEQVDVRQKDEHSKGANMEQEYFETKRKAAAPPLSTRHFSAKVKIYTNCGKIDATVGKSGRAKSDTLN